MSISFLKYSKLYYFLAGLLVLGAVASLLFFGLQLGIDFLGGSIIEVEFKERPANPVIEEKLKDFNLGEIIIQPTGEKMVIIKMKETEEETHREILSRLGELSEVKERQFENIGPVIGQELRRKTIILISVSFLALLFYIAVAFRKVSWPVSGWQYGLVSIIALCFDILITVGIFSLLGKFYNVQFNIPIVTALLTILGYTINDKVIVFDRVRENILTSRALDFEVLVDQSLNQILGRSLSTGFCSLLVLLAIFLFGGETLKYFSLTLIIGIIIGTCSSLFLASPMIVSWFKRKARA